MLAASDPQLFIPFGRKQIERHVGSSTVPTVHLSYVSSSQIESEDESKNLDIENEFWVLRENSNGIEEELYVKGKVVIWSKGNFGISLTNFCEEQLGGRILIRSYAAKYNITQALWCSFFTDEYFSKQCGLKRREIEVEAVCVLDEKQLNIYVSGSEEYFTRLPFKISSIWSTNFGLMIERIPLNLTNINSSFSHLNNFNFVPTLFALTHPVNEISPFLILKQGGILSFMREPFMKVVFVHKNPSICMLYDYKTSLHSVWKIRRTNEEEKKMMKVNYENEASTNCTTKQFWDFGQTSNSVPLSFSNKSWSSTNLSFSSSFGNRGNSHLSVNNFNSSYGKLQSPLLTTFSNCSNVQVTSPNHFPSKNLKLSQMMSPSCLNSPKCSPSVDARLGNSQTLNQNYTPMPVEPELCLEYMWTENLINKGDSNSSPASAVFISSDFIGQKYLCYLIPLRYQLFCAKLDKTNECHPETIVGTLTVIPAKDAAYLPTAKVTIIIDRSDQVLLYSGTLKVGHVVFGSISSSQHLTSSYYNSQNHIISTGSPKPSRSSLLSSTRMEEEFFDENFQQISPVKKHIFDNECDFVNTNSAFTCMQPQSIQDSIDLQATFKYSDGSYYRINFAALCTSFLVKKCLKTLKIILPRDAALNFMIMWYRSRNAPGTQDISFELEWRLFIEVLLRSLGYNVNAVFLIQNLNGNQVEEPTLPKKKKESDIGNDSDWKYLVESVYHTENMARISNLLNLKNNASVEIKCQRSSTNVSSSALLYQHFYLVFLSVHLVYEELKLNKMRYNSLTALVRLLMQLATDLHLEQFSYYYWRNHPQIIARPVPVHGKNILSDGLMNVPEFIEKPPDIFQHAFCIMKNERIEPYPFINRVNNDSHCILQLLALIFNKKAIKYDEVIRSVNLPYNRSYAINNIMEQYFSFPNDYIHVEKIVSLMIASDFTQDKLQNLPVGIAWPLIDIIHRCRECPREDWLMDEYNLLVREDLSSQVKQTTDFYQNIFKNSLSVVSWCWNEIKTTEVCDGMENMNEELMKLIWPKDRRIYQVRNMLQSSIPAVIDIQHRPDVTAHEYIEEQEKHLFGICTRTMALPVGRGMFTLHSATPSITEPLNIPKLCLIGKSANSGTSIDFSHIEVVSNMNLWPLFHNGVAAGLRILPNASVDSTWILFNKPKSGMEMIPEHAGFLMALGLNGHLRTLKRLNMYEYISKNHEMTNVALLIGLSASFRGTMDTATTKLLSLHIECLLPPTSLELDIDQNTQIAALLGIGLVYQKSAHRHIAEILLSEMGRPPGPEMENCIDRESYTLAAGLSLGLVLLGKGSDLSGLTDLEIADTLHYYMIGGHKRPLSGSQKEKYKSPSYQIREGDIVNVDVTSPGATLALGLMFFNTGNRAVADWMKAPDTQYILDIICPDFILLRTLARSLILWDDIIPTIEWVENHIPESIRPYCLVKPKPDSIPFGIDLETMNQAYCNIVAGACFAIGLRFAGSGNNTAFETVHYFCKIFITLFSKSISELAGKSTIENCLNVSVISLSLIMVGTGNVEVLRICRCLRSRICQASNTVVTYGSHLATHMALGLLFFGGGRYSLSTSSESIAALIISFYPKFPTHSNDNRYHLQAFRHLYVLAAESRLLLPRNIDDEFFVYADISVQFIDSKYYKNQEVKLTAPCLLPELKYLKKVEIKDDRYWPVVFSYGKNWNQLLEILKNSLYVNIKQRSGFLTYKDVNRCCKSTQSSYITDCGFSWSTDIEFLRKYITDPCTLKIMECFFDYDVENVISEDEIKFNSLFKRIVHECIIHDKLYLLPFWISIMKILQKICRFPNAYYSWQIKLFCQMAFLVHETSSISRFVTSLEFGIAIKHYLFKFLENCEKVYGVRLQSCFEESDNLQTKFFIEQIKCVILSIYDVPITFQLNSQLNEACPMEIYQSLKNLLSVLTLKKLCESKKN